ncbi:AI-2 transport protein TqsA [BD1-7 clade bacterium]|uniref:AI-2 transport protein TqsA n=1 Tax=BD1-7 clade bacterium TaxID=2029982 RepID=A0A5S9PY85_9GAMM|nr:AI-2 transport protein TqsA [BD1-7 clade bacterium]CAA0110121.1 AI-2 transport protein TqsA [BD1-7 clade bacterium]
MENIYRPGKGTWSIISLAALVAIMAAVKSAEAIIAPFLVAIFISALSAPVMFWLTRHRVPEWLSLTLVMTGLVGGAFLVSSLIGNSLTGFSENLPTYQKRLTDVSHDWLEWLVAVGAVKETPDVKNMVNLSAALGFVGQSLNSLVATLTNTFFILLLVVFILLELHCFGKKLYVLSDNPKRTLSYFSRFSDTLNRYIVIKTLMSAATGTLAYILLIIIDVDYPLLWGLIAFLLNYVPNIGSVIAAIPPVLLALIQFGPVQSGGVAIGYVAINSVVGNMIEPKMMGRSLGLSTLVVFLSLVVWGWLLGPVGMFLSVPLTMAVKIAMDINEKTRWISILLGSTDELPEINDYEMLSAPEKAADKPTSD